MGRTCYRKGTLFKWIFEFMFTPLSATMFALLAFFVAFVSYRAFRIRNFEATLLLISGMIIMIEGYHLEVQFQAGLSFIYWCHYCNNHKYSIFKNKIYTMVSFLQG